MLDPEQQKQLAAIAKRENTSVSKILREIIDQEIKRRKREQLTKAAKLALQDYTEDSDLTAFTALDGDDFHA
jgi:predicted transcriptional regulator